MRIPMRQLRDACPCGCPSVRSRAYESPDRIDDRRRVATGSATGAEITTEDTTDTTPVWISPGGRDRRLARQRPVPELLDQHSREQGRRSPENAPADVAIRPAANHEVEYEPRDRALAARAGDDLRNAATVGKQVALDQDRIAQLGADCAIAR